MVGNSNYPFVTSMTFVSVVIVALALGKMAKQKIGMLYVLGTLIAFTGLLFEVFSLYGTNISANTSIIIYSTIMMLFYSGGYYFSYYFAYKGLNPIKAMPYIYIPIILIAFLFGLVANSYTNIGTLNTTEIAICLLIAIAIFFGYTAEEFGYGLMRKAKLSYLNLANIFSNFDIIGAALYTVFVLSLSYDYLIIGLSLTAIGVIVVAYSR